MSYLDPSDYEIKISTTIENSILNYFAQAQTIVKNYDSYLNRHRELDFLKMRRFLHTTYNSLSEIDHSLRSPKNIKLHDTISKVAVVFDEFSIKCKLGAQAYTIVFLQQQERYTLLESLLNHNLNEIVYLQEQSISFKDHVQKYKDDLSNTPLHSKRYAEKEADLKLLKRRENSTIMRLGEVKEQNEIITEVLSEFRETYRTQFTIMYNKYTQDLRPKLLSILNAMAFEFDVHMWIEANNSDIIKNYYKHSLDDHKISSKTYLSYYLKGLDKNKLSKEHKELQELLEYLDNSNPVYCLIYMPKDEDLEQFTTTLEADKNGFVIHGFTGAKVALSKIFQTRIDIMILDLDAEEEIIESFLSLYRRNSEQLETQSKIMLVCSEVNAETIAKAELLGAHSLIEKSETAFDIIDSVYELIKVENSLTCS
jgi:hypothetical protein